MMKFPTEWNNKKCSKPPTSIYIYMRVCVCTGLQHPSKDRKTGHLENMGKPSPVPFWNLVFFLGSATKILYIYIHDYIYIYIYMQSIYLLFSYLHVLFHTSSRSQTMIAELVCSVYVCVCVCVRLRNTK